MIPVDRDDLIEVVDVADIWVTEQVAAYRGYEDYAERRFGLSRVREAINRIRESIEE